MLGPLPEREYDRKMNPEIERLLYQLDVVVTDVEGLAECAGADFTLRPAPGRWSPAEAIEHLNLTARLALPKFQTAIERARAAEKLHPGPYTYGVVERWFLGRMEPPVRGFRFKAPRAMQPGANLDAGRVTADFADLHGRLRELLKSADGLDLAGVKVESAFSRWVHYSLGMGFWLLLAHDRRHIWQARQALQQVQKTGRKAGAAA